MMYPEKGKTFYPFRLDFVLAQMSTVQKWTYSFGFTNILFQFHKDSVSFSLCFSLYSFVSTNFVFAPNVIY